MAQPVCIRISWVSTTSTYVESSDDGTHSGKHDSWIEAVRLSTALDRAVQTLITLRRDLCAGCTINRTTRGKNIGPKAVIFGELLTNKRHHRGHSPCEPGKRYAAKKLGFGPNFDTSCHLPH